MSNPIQPQRAFFLTNRLGFHVWHTGTSWQDTGVTELRKWLSDEFSLVTLDDVEVLSFHAPPPEETRDALHRSEHKDFSMVFMNLRGDFNESAMTDLFIKVAGGAPGKVLATGQAVVEMAMLDWLGSGSQNLIGGGGTGDQPSPYERHAGALLPPAITLDPSITLPLTGIAGDVHVVILDTVPSAGDTAKMQRSAAAGDPAVQFLFPPNPPLGPALRASAPPAFIPLSLNAYRLPGFNQRLSGHGTFIAGIVRSIAPNATIHLVQVMTDYAVGCFSSFASGFTRIRLLTNAAGKPLDLSRVVINCSWGLVTTTMPQFPKVLIPFYWRHIPSLWWACRPYHNQHAGIVAAAGNEHIGQGNLRPPSQQPASFDFVLSVGALAGGGNPGANWPATYSNLCNSPTPFGVMAFGGEKLDRGIVGVYLNDVSVVGTGDPLMYAYWCGTSFATAIVTGFVARYMERNAAQSARDSTQAIYNLAPAAWASGIGFKAFLVEQ